MEKIYRVQMNSKGMPNFSTAVEIADRPSKEGEWEIEEFTSIYGKGYRLTCSECGDVFAATDGALLRERYCRYCGAKNTKRWKGADDETAND